jgi:GT2 family glycosyltransferase
MSARISVVTPVFNPPAAYLEQCIVSMLSQTLTDWEWCIADDASTEPHVIIRLAELERTDDRVRLTTLASNGGISNASNAALAMVTAPIVALLDHDDELVPHALERVVETFAERKDAVYVYSDEVLIDEFGDEAAVLRKPGWSPERLRWQMYCNHFSAYRTEAVRDVGGFQPEFDGAQDHDLLLRVTERCDDVIHIPEILYRWHSAPHSTVRSTSNKPHAGKATIKAVADHCQRVGIACTTTFDPITSICKIRRELHEAPLVSIIIPTRFDVGPIHGSECCAVENCVKSIIERSTYENYEVILVQGEERFDFDTGKLERLAAGRLRISDPLALPFNFSSRVNHGVMMAKGSYVVLLNDDTEVVSPGWIEALITMAMEPDVGAVGALLRFETGELQHGGVFVHGGPGHVLFEHARESLGPHSVLALARECIGVTGACLATRRDVYINAGGFSECFPSNWNDVDFCLKLQSLGFRIIWTPLAELYHFESMSRDAAVTDADWTALRRRWSHVLELDPYRTTDTCWVGGDVSMPRNRSPRDLRIDPLIAAQIDTANSIAKS